MYTFKLDKIWVSEKRKYNWLIRLYQSDRLIRYWFYGSKLHYKYKIWWIVQIYGAQPK